MTHSRTKTRQLVVGDKVTFDYGGGLMVAGVVVEDRGNIGVGGRRLLRVRMDVEVGAEPMFIELPDSALTIVKRVA
ncbi:MAG: hypothetical protein AB7S26_40005 [Sandaracinaceae bacterium]